MNHRTDGELQAYLDAELHRDEAAVVAQHLMVCTDCRVRLGELRMAAESFRQALGELDTRFEFPPPGGSAGDCAASEVRASCPVSRCPPAARRLRRGRGGRARLSVSRVDRTADGWWRGTGHGRGASAYG